MADWYFKLFLELWLPLLFAFDKFFDVFVSPLPWTCKIIITTKLHMHMQYIVDEVTM